MISVIVPVYNAGHFLKRCIDSVVAQTYTCWELLLTDDGSTDESLSVCRAYSVGRDNVSVFSLAHGGVSLARNYALSKAHGDYICFVDADDELHPDFFKKAIAVMQHNEKTDIVHVDHFRVNGRLKSVVRSSWSGFYEKEQIRDLIIPDCIGPSDNDLGKRQLFTSVWGLLIRKDLAAECCFNERISVMEDKLFLVEILLRAKGVFYMNEPLYLYYVNEGSAMSSYHSGLNENMITLLEELRLIRECYYKDSSVVSERIENLSFIAWWSVCYNEFYSKAKIKDSVANIKKFAAYVKRGGALSYRKCVKLLDSNITWLLLFAHQYAAFIKLWRKHLGL